MIFSFSVPEGGKYAKLIEWYRNADKNERSIQFRKIFMAYLEGTQNIVESRDDRVSLGIKTTELERIDIVGGSSEVDLDSKLDSIGIFGGGD
jgi:hypothetical protein